MTKTRGLYTTRRTNRQNFRCTQGNRMNAIAVFSVRVAACRPLARPQTMQPRPGQAWRSPA
ncbi:MAG: hypothetical protein LBF51_01920 [Zoogloeaceae bacterium]|nr:hypothetical protein [Zoogloeaceae bacterium]